MLASHLRAKYRDQTNQHGGPFDPMQSDKAQCANLPVSLNFFSILLIQRKLSSFLLRHACKLFVYPRALGSKNRPELAET